MEMETMNLEDLICSLRSSKPSQGYRAFQQLLEIGRDSDVLSGYLEEFLSLSEGKNSYLRTRGLLLLCANAKWDSAGKINAALERILGHITDEKPIVSRQFIQSLPELLQGKPEVREQVREALLKADLSRYADSMQPLVERDIQKTLSEI